ncbi:unnamed protein product [Mortierella alpina]
MSNSYVYVKYVLNDLDHLILADQRSINVVDPFMVAHTLIPTASLAIMAKHKTGTPPGTGSIGCLTPGQKRCLKEVWAAVLTFLAANESTPDPRKPRRQSPSKKNRASVLEKVSEMAFCTDRVAELVPDNTGDYGLYGVALREALWSNALGDHPDNNYTVLLRAKLH